MSHRIPLESGSPEGTNSAYLLPERGVLLDPGPPVEDAWSRLTAGVTESGLALTDVDHVVVTHWHLDHAGLAPRFAEAASATIHMHERDAPFVRTYEETHRRRRERDRSVMERWGVPADRRRAVADADASSPLPAETPVTGHADGDTIAGATVWHTPGHTAGHLALVADEACYVGDAVLPTYTPNVGGSDTRMDDPLLAYAGTLDRLDAGETRLRPGHGRHLQADRIAVIREHHRERSRRVFDLVRSSSPTTPWTVARDLFGEMTGIHVKFGAGEAAAHLGLLDTIGGVSRTASDPDRYAAERQAWPDAGFPF